MKRFNLMKIKNRKVTHVAFGHGSYNDLFIRFDNDEVIQIDADYIFDKNGNRVNYEKVPIQKSPK
jgi:hypothetical protein